MAAITGQEGLPEEQPNQQSFHPFPSPKQHFDILNPSQTQLEELPKHLFEQIRSSLLLLMLQDKQTYMYDQNCNALTLQKIQNAILA